MTAKPAAAVLPRLFSTSDAAVYLGRSEGAVAKLIERGAFPVVRSDRRRFLDRRDLDAWIEGNKE